MASKIPPELHDALLQKSAAGEGTRSIAAWLGREHGVKVSHECVASLIRKEGGRRSSAAKTIARTRLATAVTTDIERTTRLLKKAQRIARLFEDDPDRWAKLARVQIDLLALRAKLSGVDQPDAAQAPAAVVLDPETVRRMAAEVLEKP